MLFIFKGYPGRQDVILFPFLSNRSICCCCLWFVVSLYYMWAAGSPELFTHVNTCHVLLSTTHVNTCHVLLPTTHVNICHVLLSTKHVNTCHVLFCTTHANNVLLVVHYTCQHMPCLVVHYTRQHMPCLFAHYICQHMPCFVAQYTCQHMSCLVAHYTNITVLCAPHSNISTYHNLLLLLLYLCRASDKDRSTLPTKEDMKVIYRTLTVSQDCKHTKTASWLIKMSAYSLCHRLTHWWFLYQSFPVIWLEKQNIVVSMHWNTSSLPLCDWEKTEINKDSWRRISRRFLTFNGFFFCQFMTLAKDWRHACSLILAETTPKKLPICILVFAWVFFRSII